MNPLSSKPSELAIFVHQSYAKSLFHKILKSRPISEISVEVVQLGPAQFKSWPKAEHYIYCGIHHHLYAILSTPSNKCSWGQKLLLPSYQGGPLRPFHRSQKIRYPIGDRVDKSAAFLS